MEAQFHETLGNFLQMQQHRPTDAEECGRSKLFYQILCQVRYMETTGKCIEFQCVWLHVSIEIGSQTSAEVAKISLIFIRRKAGI